MKEKNLYTVRKDEMISHLVYFLHCLDEAASRDDIPNSKEHWILHYSAQACATVEIMVWCGMISLDESEIMIRNIPHTDYGYNRDYDKFVEFYKSLGGEYLASFDRV